jgi:hypothetical protein
MQDKAIAIDDVLDMSSDFAYGVIEEYLDYPVN